MKKLNLVLALLIVSSVLFAQKDEKALKILKKVEKIGLAHKSISATIEYNLENQQEKTNEKLTGTILIKNNKFQFIIDNTETYCNGKTKWIYLTESDEVNVSDVVSSKDMEPEEQFINNPISIFSLYKTNFKYLLRGEQTIDKKTYSVIDLTPESLKKPYFKIRMLVSAQNNIYSVKYFQKDGVRITLHFKNFKTNVKTSESDFNFDEKKHPNVEVIDLRE